MRQNPQETVDLFTFTEEILSGKLHFYFVVIDFDPFFEKLLRRDSCTTLHQRNLQKLMTEIFKVKTGIDPDLVVFEFTDALYNLRNQSKCNHSTPCTERYGIEMASCIGPNLYDKVPTEIKKSKSLE